MTIFKNPISTMAKNNSLRRIPISEITKRHPQYLTCSTDAEYAKLANDLYDMLESEMDFTGESAAKNVCVSLALYFEDLQSNTHQFETFTKLYSEMFGYYVPFHHSKNADDMNADLDAMKFVFWFCCTAERNGNVLNPKNDGLADLAQKIWEYWLTVSKYIRPNDDLYDYLYCEETQNMPVLVKNVLIWLQHDSFLGRWYSNPSPENDPFGITRITGKSASPSQLKYGIRSYSVFKCRTWPLSLRAQHIYAEMIRIEMEDPKDELAAIIDNMEGSEFGVYEILDSKGRYVKVRDFKGDEYDVRSDSFDTNVKGLIKSKKHIIGSFFKYDGEWYTSGLSMFTTVNHIENYQQKARLEYEYMHKYVGQYDAFIKKHKGNRMFFLANKEELLTFYKNELGLRNVDPSMLGAYQDDIPVMVFFEPNGQLTLSFEAAASVKHPDNPYYTKSIAEENGLAIIGGTSCCSPNALIYMIENGYLPDALLNDIRGREYGKQTMQENMEFIARCFRRDICADNAFSKRSDSMLPEEDGLTWERYRSKIGYEEFVSIISEQKSILSSARKEWMVESCNSVEIIMSDPRNNKKFYIGTRDLYEAHLGLESNEIQVSTVAPFVGRENASAASALLYNIVGRGKVFNDLRKNMDKLFPDLRSLFESNGKG